MSTVEVDPRLERDYNARAAVPEHEEISGVWAEKAAAYRQVATAEYDIPYGPGERNKFDLFHPGGGVGAKAPILVYIHGGYWKSRDRKVFSHVARPFNDTGLAVVVPSYTLCPEVTIPEIIEEMRACVGAVWRKTGRRPAVAGHSAGGHLAACMVGTDWAATDGVPDDLVTAGYAVSGLFDLTPLRRTSVNAELNLTPESARAASPALWSIPAAGRRLVAAAGLEETAGFIEQSEMMAARWAEAGAQTAYVPVPGKNHFTIIDELLGPGSDLVETVGEMARAALG